MVEQAHYAAFLSYSHCDRSWAAWLHRALENYAVPRRLVRTHGTFGDVSRRLRPIFRDRDELPASADLSRHIEAALSVSGALVVLCSPNSARSRWCNEEIATFKRMHPDRPILAAIIAGEPHASDIAGREGEECFPPALREKFDARGEPTGERAEPIAADFRSDADGRKLGKLKLVAGMLGVGLNDLVRRDTTRRNRQLAWLAAASLTGMALTSSLALFAFAQRAEAFRQRAQADGLIEFMLTDLRKKLEPVGRLDVLDSVGERALTYYASQDPEKLDADALGRRARALQLVGQVANMRGNLDRALTLFRQAAATTAVQLRRDPRNPQRLFDHSQSVFWVGYVAWQRGDRATAHQFFSEYRDYAKRLFAVSGDENAWKAELGYAETNLGVLALDGGDGAEALGHFGRAQEVWSLLRKRAPQDRTYQYEAAQSLAWHSDTRRSMGDYKAALGDRLEEADLYRDLLARDAADTKAAEGLSVSLLRTARLHLESGSPGKALELAGLSLRGIRDLEAKDPSNSLWKEMAVKSANMRAEALMLAGNWRSAQEVNDWALERATRLVATDTTVASWRSDCLMPARWMQIAIDQRIKGTDAARTEIERFDKDFPLAGDPRSDDERFARIMVRSLAGVNWSRLHDRRRAQRDFTEAMRLLPGSDKAMNARMAAMSRLIGSAVPGARTVKASPGPAIAAN